MLDTAKLRIGEQAKIDIYLNYAANRNVHIEWPSIGDTLTEKVEVISISPIDTTFPDKTNSTRILQHQQITVSVYDSGYYAIPGFKFIIDKDTAHPLYTQPLFLEVHTVPTDSSATKTKDIKPPLNEPFNWKWYINYLYAGIALLAIILATLLITIYFARKRRELQPEPDKPKIPPHIIALAALEQIKEEASWKEGRVKEYYSAISDTVRAYIEDRFYVHALESTTDEIMTAFRSQVVDRESKDRLQQLLTLSDLVKFAKQFPIEDEHVFTLQNAFDFVNGTKREEEMPAGAFDYTQAASTQQASATPPPSSANTVSLGDKPAYPASAPSSSSPQTTPGNSFNAPVQRKKKNNTVIIIACIVAALLLAVATYFMVTKLLLRSTTPGSQDMSGAIKDLNAGYPTMLDSETRIDSAAMVDDKTMAYYYTLVNVQYGQIDTEEMRRQVRINTVNEVRTNPAFKAIRELPGTLQYYFRDKAGRDLFQVSVSPEDYLN